MEQQQAEEYIDSVFESSFGGIEHIELIDGFITTAAPITGTPIEEAGLGAADRILILAANGRDLRGAPLQKPENQACGYLRHEWPPVSPGVDRRTGQRHK